MVLGVPSEVCRDAVNVAVAVEVAACEAIPPARELFETGALDPNELAGIVVEEFDSSPLMGDEEITPAISVRIRPEGAAVTMPVLERPGGVMSVNLPASLRRR